jgi:hypothetical protein
MRPRHHVHSPSADDVAARSMSEVGWPVTLPGPANDGEGMLRKISLRQSTVDSSSPHADETGAVKLFQNTFTSAEKICTHRATRWRIGGRHWKRDLDRLSSMRCWCEGE